MFQLSPTYVVNLEEEKKKKKKKKFDRKFEGVGRHFERILNWLVQNIGFALF